MMLIQVKYKEKSFEFTQDVEKFTVKDLKKFIKEKSIILPNFFHFSIWLLTSVFKCMQTAQLISRMIVKL
jgi:hypothetical protein